MLVHITYHYQTLLVMHLGHLEKVFPLLTMINCMETWHSFELFFGFSINFFDVFLGHCILSFNPLSPDSAIWHNMQLQAQYSVNLHEICTTKRYLERSALWRHNIRPPPIQDLIYHPCNFWNLCLGTFYTKLISDNKLCTESCKLSYS